MAFFRSIKGCSWTAYGPAATSISRSVLSITGSQGNSCSTRSPQKPPSGSGVAHCSSLVTAHQLLRRREVVSILGDIAPSQEALFLSLLLLDMSHRRWSSFNASVALEFGDIHSLAAAASVTIKLLPGSTSWSNS